MAEREELLADRTSGDFQLVTHETTVATAAASAAAYAVIVDATKSPLAAVSQRTLATLEPTATLLSAARLAPAVVIADAAISVDALLDSPAFRPVAPEVVVALDGERVMGVWAGAALSTEALSHTSRFSGDWSLPGHIRVPKLVLICRKVAFGRRCSASLELPELPQQLPPCPDPDNLGPHLFTL